MSDLFPKKIGTYLPVGTNKNNKNTLPSINSLGEYAVEANAMPFKQAWRPVLHLPSSLSAQLLAKEKHEKQSPSETKVPSYWKMFFVYGFYCFCSCGMKDPKGFMTARQIKGQVWLEALVCLDGMKALKELIPQECFFMFLSIETIFWQWQ